MRFRLGEGWGGGSGGYGKAVPHSTTPTPNPSPQGGGEEFAAPPRCKLTPVPRGLFEEAAHKGGLLRTRASLLQAQQVCPRAFLRDLHVTLHGIVADHIG